MGTSKASVTGTRRWWWACTQTAHTRSSTQTRDWSRSMCPPPACDPLRLRRPVRRRGLDHLLHRRQACGHRARRRHRLRACGHRVLLQVCQRALHSSRAIACLGTSRAWVIGMRRWWWACMRTAHTRSSTLMKGSSRSTCPPAACGLPVALRLRRSVRRRGLDHLLRLRRACGHQGRRRHRLRACGHRVLLQACQHSSRATACLGTSRAWVIGMRR